MPFTGTADPSPAPDATTVPPPPEDDGKAGMSRTAITSPIAR
jgi:hypothetical protein